MVANSRYSAGLEPESSPSEISTSWRLGTVSPIKGRSYMGDPFEYVEPMLALNPIRTSTAGGAAKI
jgi:hypothetical protein